MDKLKLVMVIVFKLELIFNAAHLFKKIIFYSKEVKIDSKIIISNLNPRYSLYELKPFKLTFSHSLFSSILLSFFLYEDEGQ
jgi:hypothetical protein